MTRRPHKQNRTKAATKVFPSSLFFSLHFFTVCFLFFHSIKIWIFTLERKIPRFHLHKRRTKTHTHVAVQFFVLNQPTTLHFLLAHPSQHATQNQVLVPVSSCVSKITTKKHSHTSAKN
uniref:(northern house mosquito) hypothetical protein n=1 Tax=Culex pipiens TaxID=7175 RepID=A0A8D8LDY0_CULPI